MYNNEYQEREIDLLDIMWRLLEQWKLIIVVALIGAIVLPLLMGIKSGLSSSATVSTEIEDTEIVVDAATQQQLNADYNAISSALSSYMEYKTLEYLYQNSILNQVDFKNGTSVSSVYEIRLGDSSQRIQSLYSLYIDIVNNDAFTDTLLAEYSSDAIDSSLYDVCTVSGFWSTNPSNSNMEVNADTSFGEDVAIITVKTTLPADASLDEWNETLDSAIKAYEKNVEKSVGQHQVTLISTNSRQANDVSLARTQNQKANEVSTAQNNYKTAYAALTDDNKQIIDKLVDKYEVKTGYNLFAARTKLDKLWVEHTKDVASTSVVGTTDAGSITSAFGKRNIVLGFMLAVVLYVCIYFAYVIFNKNIKNPEDIESTVGINNFGNVYEYPYTTSFERFAHDKKIYAMRHKGTSADKIAEDLAARLSFDEKSGIHLVVCGEGTEKTDAILAAQKSKLEAQGKTVSIIKLDKPVSEMYDSEFSKMNNVFLQVISGQTTYNMIRELCTKLKEYNVDIIGSEFIEIA
ncbi:hypothetical protein [Pseudobutyrivibrio sp.]|uniref:hypothetical protein n=1 Tax=Pseudobutyrivibrio sp. TaxID=2014367 RepID=UPI001B453824|nr:hypothetical protein [Pseudobutyrivibrio sp.]MBP3260751.1 hypothetical protein [Pseudobutyrivibrio sp.]